MTRALPDRAGGRFEFSSSLTQRQRLLLESIWNQTGNVGAALRERRLSRPEYNRWMKNDPLFRAAHDDIMESFIDLAESKLFQAIQGNQPWAVCFFLKCRAKQRGYVERTESVDLTALEKQVAAIMMAAVRVVGEVISDPAQKKLLIEKLTTELEGLGNVH